jgi:hypothetical protein
MHPGLFIQYFQIMVSPLQQRLLLVKYHCRSLGGVAVRSQDFGDATCRPARLLEKTSAGNLIPPATASSTYHRHNMPVRGSFVYETTVSWTIWVRVDYTRQSKVLLVASRCRSKLVYRGVSHARRHMRCPAIKCHPLEHNRDAMSQGIARHSCIQNSANGAGCG